MRQRFHEARRFITNLGITPEMSKGLARRVKAANVMTATLLALTVLYTPFVVWLGSPILTVVIPLVGVLYAACLWLSARRRYASARLVMLAVFNCTVFYAYESLGDITGLPIMLLCTSALSMIVFEVKERAGVIVGLGLPVGLFAATAFNDFAPFPALLELAAPLPKSMIGSIATFITSVGIIAAGLAYLNAVNDQQGLELTRQRDEILEASAKLKALGEMAAGIGHEINNPVTTISAWSDELSRMLAQGQLDRGKVALATRRIGDASRRVAMIVRGLKGLSRAGDLDPFQPASLEDIIQETLAICAERLRREQIVATVELAAGPLFLECRATQISQVLLNLLNNACDAVQGLPDRWIKIAVKENSQRIELSVTDSGPGIPQDVRAQMNTIFFSTKPAGKGTGIGLSIVRRIVADHAGAFTLDVEAPNTRFVIDIPKRPQLVANGR